MATRSAVIGNERVSQLEGLIDQLHGLNSAATVAMQVYEYIGAAIMEWVAHIHDFGFPH